MDYFEMAVASDLIGVIANADEAVIRCANGLYGVDLGSTTIKRDIVVYSGIMTEEQYRIVQRVSASKWEWARWTKIIPDVKEVLALLQEMGCVLSVITSRTDEDGYPMLSTTIRWLREQELLVYLSAVKGVGYHKSKESAIQELNPRPVVYIDDSLEKLLFLRGVVENLFLFIGPHNRHVELPPDIGRIDSWWQIYNVICELQKELLVVVTR